MKTERIYNHLPCRTYSGISTSEVEKHVRMHLGGVWLGGENGGEKSNLNSIFIFIIWLDKIYKNLIFIRI